MVEYNYNTTAIEVYRAAIKLEYNYNRVPIKLHNTYHTTTIHIQYTYTQYGYNAVTTWLH